MKYNQEAKQLLNLKRKAIQKRSELIAKRTHYIGTLAQYAQVYNQPTVKMPAIGGMLKETDIEQFEKAWEEMETHEKKMAELEAQLEKSDYTVTELLTKTKDKRIGKKSPIFATKFNYYKTIYEDYYKLKRSLEQLRINCDMRMEATRPAFVEAQKKVADDKAKKDRSASALLLKLDCERIKISSEKDCAVEYLKGIEEVIDPYKKMYTDLAVGETIQENKVEETVEEV